MTTGGRRTTVTAQLLVDGEPRTVMGEGNGPIDALVGALRADLGVDFEVKDYSEHALTAGSGASAVAYVEAEGADGSTWWGVGMDSSILDASLAAVVSAASRARRAAPALRPTRLDGRPLSVAPGIGAYDPVRHPAPGHHQAAPGEPRDGVWTGVQGVERIGPRACPGRPAAVKRNDAITRRDRFINDHLVGLDADSLVVNVGCGVVRRFESDLPRPLHGHRPPGALQRRLRVGRHPHPARRPLRRHGARPRAARARDPSPGRAPTELARVLKPGGTVILSVPSAVPRHDDHDYWRFTAEGLAQLGAEVFGRGEVHVFGGTFEALGYLLSYYIALVFHVVGCPGRFRELFPSVGHWLDRRTDWSTSTTALHTLAFDLLFVGTGGAGTPEVPVPVAAAGPSDPTEDWAPAP